jgi:hypothetical protein
MAARRIKARSWSTLTAEQWTTLAIGRIRGEPDGFDSETDLRACWAQHRARFMASCNPGHRPGAWWILESPQPYDPPVGRLTQPADR